MNNLKIVTVLFVVCFLFLSVHIVSAKDKKQGTVVDDLVQGILNDVIDRTVRAAEEVVRENTDIDIYRRGYEYERKHRPIPRDSSDKMRRELKKLQEEHDRKIRKLEEDLRRKLTKLRDKFEREAARENKPEKLKEKRAKLKEKATKAYDKFREKVNKENRRFDKKRDKIVNKAARE